MNGPRMGVDVRTGLKIEVTFEEGAADTGAGSLWILDA